MNPDPSAYRYLRDSIFEFGDGLEFERDLEACGFRIETRRSFLLGATRLWAATTPESALQNAAAGGSPRREMPHRVEPRIREWETWAVIQTLISGLLAAALVYGFIQFTRLPKDLPMAGWQKWGLGLLLGGGALFFAVRTLYFALRRGAPPPPR